MEHRGDIFQSIINSAPVPVIWMSESVNEVDGMRRSDRKGGGFGEGGRGGGRRGGRRKKASRRGEKKYNGAIIKYKRWDTYYGDYGSFPYIWSTLPASQGECSGACQRQDRRRSTV